MSKPVFSDPFVFRGVRRNRQSFLQSLAFQALCWICMAMTAYRLVDGDWSSIGTGGIVFAELTAAELMLVAFMAFATVPLVLSYLAAGTQRCRDCGISGWAALALLVPPLNVPMLIALALCKGQEGANKYGETPLKRVELSTRFDALLDVKPIEE
ncbi:DUF805 domain-containing protein [Hwanghaeella grinnelliae]|uniref:DUF805 domain-containing protein n=1 Tax=Hwanghaeella grinnelliae TaxID=2500179 RepID=A0A437QJL2_9PROT|nr:DUF805 domain-containing protein [Hwanghaeella grinnelliae]RVU34682.1 DUF805 domain-containing protein [Hwanghaeella grinnelliae]